MANKRDEIITLPTGNKVIVTPTFNEGLGAWEYDREAAFKSQAPSWSSWFRFRRGLQEKMFRSTLGRHTGVVKLDTGVTPAQENELVASKRKVL